MFGVCDASCTDSARTPAASSALINSCNELISCCHRRRRCFRLCRSRTYRRAVLFVDNAGAEVLLGMLPLARQLLRRGTEVVVAANSLPAINDITAAELDALLPQVGAAWCTAGPLCAAKVASCVSWAGVCTVQADAA